MNIRKWWPQLLIVFIIAIGLCFFARGMYFNTNEMKILSSDIFVGSVLFLSIAIAIFAYNQARNNDEYKIAEDRRHFYITDSVMRRVRMLVEHNDIELQTVVLMTNIAEVRQSGVLSEKALKMRNDFDDYLNYMEGVAILANRGSMFKESLEGLWTYYFKGLRRSHTLDFSNAKIQVDRIKEYIDSLCATSQAASHVKDSLDSVLQKKNESSEEVRDPIERKYIKNSEKAAIIHPVERPIWFYVNNPGYEFVPIIAFEKKIYQYDRKLYKTKQKWLQEIQLDRDGLEPISKACTSDSST